MTITILLSFRHCFSQNLILVIFDLRLPIKDFGNDDGFISVIPALFSRNLLLVIFDLRLPIKDLGNDDYDTPVIPALF